MIADDTGRHLMQRGMVDLVIVGTDRVAANGDVCNKIGRSPPMITACRSMSRAAVADDQFFDW